MLKGSLVSLVAIISNAQAATFGVGNGDAVILNDAAAVYYNPAGLTSITNPQLIVGDMIAITNIEFEGRTTNFASNETQVGSASSNTLIHLPSFFYAMPLNKFITAGVGFLNPFYGIDAFTDTSIIRYSGTGALIVTYDYTPGIGIKLSDTASIGLGFDAQYLNSYENFMFPPVTVPGSTGDLKSLNSMNGWGYGGHAGMLLHPIPKTYLGVTYHSQISAHPSGISTLQIPGVGSAESRDLKYQIMLPPCTVISIYQLLSDQLSVLGTAEYTQWSTVRDIFIQNVAIGNNETVSFHQLFNYHDTWRFGLSGYYQIDNKWLFRGSFSFDQDPSDPKTLIANVPSMDLYILGVGAQYQLTKSLILGFAYSHSFYVSNPINFISAANTQIGILKEKNDCVGVRLTWNI
ncbi:MAG: outer membrane protein transport protein [Gammaproteobacteria bacterium]